MLASAIVSKMISHYFLKEKTTNRLTAHSNLFFHPLRNQGYKNSCTNQWC